jgi:hypothetical protein
MTQKQGKKEKIQTNLVWCRCALFDPLLRIQKKGKKLPPSLRIPLPALAPIAYVVTTEPSKLSPHRIIRHPKLESLPRRRRLT